MGSRRPLTGHGPLQPPRPRFAYGYAGQAGRLVRRSFIAQADQIGTHHRLLPPRLRLARARRRTEILQLLERPATPRSVDVCVHKLRQRIGPDLITTVPGVGYSFPEAVEKGR